MANVTISPDCSFDATSAQRAATTTRPLGEDVLAGNGLELRADGKLYKFTGTRPLVGVAGTAGNANPAFAPTGHTFYGIGFKFSPNKTLEPGKVYFANAGGLIDDAPVAGVDTQGAFLAISNDQLEVIRLGELA